MKWRISAADRASGADRVVLLDADDEASAVKAAQAMGLLVESVTPERQQAFPAAREPGRARWVTKVPSLIVAAVCVVLGAAVWIAHSGSSRGEPTYQGKPLSEWVRLSADSDSETSRRAIVALMHMREPAAEEAIKAAFERYPLGASRAVCTNVLWFRWKPEVLAALQQELQDPVPAPPSLLLGIFERIGVEGKPLRPFVLRAAAAEKYEHSREDWAKILALIGD